MSNVIHKYNVSISSYLDTYQRLSKTTTFERFLHCFDFNVDTNRFDIVMKISTSFDKYRCRKTKTFKLTIGNTLECSNISNESSEEWRKYTPNVLFTVLEESTEYAQIERLVCLAEQIMTNKASDITLFVRPSCNQVAFVFCSDTTEKLLSHDVEISKVEFVFCL